MSNEITFKLKRGVSGGGEPSGLTHGELAINTTDKRLFVGGITGLAEPLNNRIFISVTENPEGNWYPIAGDRWWTGIAGGTEKIWDGSAWQTVSSGGGLASGLSGATITGGNFTGGSYFHGGIFVVSGGGAVTGNFVINGNLTVNGTFPTSGGYNPNLLFVANAGVSASRGATFDGPVNLLSDVTINNSSARTLTVKGKTTFEQGVSVAGSAVVSDIIIANNGISAQGGATFGGTVAATLRTAAQPNITSVGTLTSLTASGLATFNSGLHIPVNGYIGQFVNFSSSVGAWARGIFFQDSIGTTAGIGLYGQGLTPDFIYLGHGDAPWNTGVFIKKSGNVGIGNNIPGYKLDIVGSSTNWDGIVVRNSNTNAYANILGMGANSSGTIPTWTPGSFLFEGVPQGSGNTIIGSYSNNLVFHTNNRQERMRIDPAGNVGIGTNNPIRPTSSGTTVAIAGTSGGTLVLYDTDTTSNYRNKYIRHYDGILEIGKAGDDGSSPVPQLTIDFPGNVLLPMNGSNPLGTTGTRLISDVNASGALKITTPYGYVTVGPQNTAYSHFYTDISTFYFNRPIQINQASGQATIAGYDPTLPFTIGSPNASSGSIVNRITVLTGPDAVTGGYVGIGTSTPQAKLDVAGNAVIRGSASITGGLSVTGGVTLKDGLNVQTGGMSVQGPATFVSGINVTNGITGTLNTASQPNITSVGTLTSLTASGLATFNAGITSDHLYVSKGATFNGPIKIAGITGGLSVTGGATITGGVALFGTVTVNGAAIGALPANVARTDTDQVFTATQRFNAGIHVTGGASITGGLTAYGPARIIGTLDVTGGTATFISMQVGNITGAYFMSQQGFTAEYIHAVHIGGGLDSVGLDISNQGLATRLASGLEQVYRWGAKGLLSANNSYGYYRLSGTVVTTSIFPPPSSVSNNHLPIAKSIQKIVDYTQRQYSFGQIALLQDKSLTAWGFRIASTFPSFPQPTVSFIDVATGGSGTIGANTLMSYESAGWWLGLMENGRLTGGTWHAGDKPISGTFLLSTTDHAVVNRMPASLRWDSVSGITAKAILSTDDAYCYAILSDGSLTAWGATCFMIGGSGGAGTWTTGGTGGILSNFPPPTDTFTGFASRRANRTVAFAIKPDGNLRCVGYTGNRGIVSGSPSGMRLVDYRSIFCNTRTGDDQIVKVETICDSSYSQNSIYGSQISPSPASAPGQFIHKMYRTSLGNDWRIFVGLTKGGSLTAGVHIVNDSAFPSSFYLHPFSEMWNQYTSTPGITFSDISCGPRVILGKKADSSVVAYGLTNDLSPGSQDNIEWYQVTQVPSAFLQGRTTTTRFGGPVNITYSPLGESDPYTASSLLDVRGGVVAGGFSIASDSSLKTNVEEKQVGDKVVSLWKKDLLDNLSAKEFTYIGDQNTTPNIGYFAEDVKNANEYYVTQINPVSINADRPPSSTDETNTPYSAINLNALMVGTIESLRELDMEMSRIWTMESPPYPSKVKNGDLWYYSGENRLYVRRNNAWIQVN